MHPHRWVLVLIAWKKKGIQNETERHGRKRRRNPKQNLHKKEVALESNSRVHALCKGLATSWTRKHSWMITTAVFFTSSAVVPAASTVILIWQRSRRSHSTRMCRGIACFCRHHRDGSPSCKARRGSRRRLVRWRARANRRFGGSPLPGHRWWMVTLSSAARLVCG